MQRSAGDIEEVPYGVEPAHPLAEREKDDADGIGDPAREEQRKFRGGERRQKLREHRERHPARDAVERHADRLDDLIVHGDGVHRDPRDGARPFDAEHDPPRRGAAERDETVRRIRSRNEQEDGAVIEDAEHALCSAVGQEVIERAHRVQRDRAEPEQGYGDHGRGIGIAEHEEHRPEYEPQSAAHDVGYGVEDLFALGIKG